MWVPFSVWQAPGISPTLAKSVPSCVYKGTIMYMCPMTGLYITKYWHTNYRIAGKFGGGGGG